MARRRSQRTGYLRRKGPSWILRWREDVRSAAGEIARHKFARVIGPAAGPAALTRKQAQRLSWETVLQRLDTTGLHPGSLLTLRQFVDAHFRPHLDARCRLSGQIYYRYLLRKWVLPALGDLRLRDVAPADIEQLLQQLARAGRAAKTARHVQQCAAAIFRLARRLRHYSGDLPTDGAQPHRGQAAVRPALSWDQARALIAALPPPIDTLALLLATTGLRIGEACALRWRSIRVDLGVVQVRENYVLGHYGPPKSSRSTGDVPLPRAVQLQLQRLRQRRAWIAPEDPVFAARNGRPLDQHNAAARILKPAARRLGIPWASWHCFRHTAASLTDQLGLTEAERQKLLRHTAASMTLHYTHADRERIRQAVDQLADRLSAAILPTI